MSLIRYTPYPLTNLQQQINRMFDQFDNRPHGRSEELGGGSFSPAVDVKEDANAYTVHVEVPGIAQDKLHISLQENVLTIRGEKEQKQESADGQYRRIERSYGSFARALTLPRSVDAGGVTAQLREGVLEVRLPKQEESKPHQIDIRTETDLHSTGTNHHTTGTNHHTTESNHPVASAKKVDVTDKGKAAPGSTTEQPS